MARSRTVLRVRDRDRGWSRLRREVFGIDKHVTVGVHAEDTAREAGGLGNVELMAIHEFGSERASIPERSVIRYTMDKNEVRYRSLIKALGKQVYTLRITTKMSLELLGAKVASDMRQVIAKTPGVWEALKAGTIRQREHGGTKPLLDRSDLQKSIKHRTHP